MKRIVNFIGDKLNIEHWKVIGALLAIYDIFAVSFSYAFCLWLRFDCRWHLIPDYYLNPYLRFMPIYAILCVITFVILKMYRIIWRFASYNELLRTGISSVITCIIQVVGITVFFKRMPMSYYIMGAVIQFLLIAGIRFSYRFFILMGITGRHNIVKSNNVMLVGAGSAGQMILRDINHARETADKVVCIIDDDPNKRNRYIDGIPVVGNRDEILENVEKYDVNKIYIALPNSSVEEKRGIIDICKESGCELKQLPGMYQLVNGSANVTFMRNVAIEDLLGRDAISVDNEEIFRYLSGKTIMVTGGGGSIGSELCRQIAKHNPKLLLVFDIYENNAYDIEQELRTDFPGVNLKVLIGSVRDSKRVMSVFEEYKPDVVYHAAAHKHVPLMEDSPCEAIKNNALGTYKMAYAAMKYGCSRFVLISTDKAVNPTNIMGASKRLCEMIIQSFDKMIKSGEVDKISALFKHDENPDDVKLYQLDASKVKTEFVAVRFGNVLGSNGSVVPLFKKQIANGGPVTVTHPDIIRYFMTIPEAVSLVLQAGTYAHGGEIFVLDMGEPVKIDTLARNLIKLSGLRPDVDIKIEYTGLRPGEKLYEEKLMAEEGLKTTPNKLIHIGQPLDFDAIRFQEDIRELMESCYANSDDIEELVKRVVKTYKPN